MTTLVRLVRWTINKNERPEWMKGGVLAPVSYELYHLMWKLFRNTMSNWGNNPIVAIAKFLNRRYK